MLTENTKPAPTVEVIFTGQAKQVPIDPEHPVALPPAIAKAVAQMAHSVALEHEPGTGRNLRISNIEESPEYLAAGCYYLLEKIKPAWGSRRLSLWIEADHTYCKICLRRNE